MVKHDEDIDCIKKQFIDIYKPKRLILFGSQAKDNATIKSDIDLCVVSAVSDKRALLADMYLNIECGRPFDIILYTPEEWDLAIADKSSFAYQIDREGIVLYAGQQKI